jgi:hypothetical protein
MKERNIDFSILLLSVALFAAAVILVNFFPTSVAKGAHTAPNYLNCPAGPGFGGADGFCEPDTPPNYFSNIAQNVSWCQNTPAHTYSCLQACQDAGYGSTTVCPQYSFDFIYHPTQDFGYLYQGTCSISGTPCQGPDQTKGWVGGPACSEPTINSTWCGAVLLLHNPLV